MAPLSRLLIVLCAGTVVWSANAEPPGVSYIFPAGAQRGTQLQFRVGGFYFHGQAEFQMDGEGVKASPVVKETETIWFEGPRVNEPESQKKEDYPKDHLGELAIAPDAEAGVRWWHCRTSQGAIPSMKFVIGDLPEIIEKEIDGAPIPQEVTLPLTINGRIFPREDVDQWRFHAEKGQTIVCELAAQGLGYPLQAVLDLTGPGHTIVPCQSSRDGDPLLSFTAPETGEYQIAVHDAGFTGGQNFVYRLTLTIGPRIESWFPLGGRRGETVRVKCVGPGIVADSIPVSLANVAGDSITRAIEFGKHGAGAITLHVDDLPEFTESSGIITTPAILNGRIEHAGELDAWSFDLADGQTVLLDLLAAQLGSKLDSVLTIHDAEGKELARNDDRADGGADSRLLFTASKTGRYTATVSDRFASRGGEAFGYRLRVTPHLPADFELKLSADAFNLTRQTEEEAKPADSSAAPKKPTVKIPGLRVDLVPLGSFAKDITLSVCGLPPGVTAAPIVLKAKQKFAEIQFIAPPRTAVQVVNITISGTSELDGKPVTHQATMPVPFGEPQVDQVRLAIVPPVPFKFTGHHVFTNDQGGGTTATKHYLLDRGGYQGPLTASLSDREIRYLRGVSGPPVTIPELANEFDFTVNYPVDIEQGHTSRVQIMVVGEITDFDGSRHKVSYTSATNDEQFVCSTTAGPLRLSTTDSSFPVVPGGRVVVPVTIQRAPSLAHTPLTLSLKLPRHMTGISAAPVHVDGESGSASFVIEFGPHPGPFNMPVSIVGQTRDDAKLRYIGEMKIELVSLAETASR